jgi:hypothetical protein
MVEEQGLLFGGGEGTMTFGKGEGTVAFDSIERKWLDVRYLYSSL